MAKTSSTAPSAPKVTRDHRRQFERCQYVYPVVSRRARGVSIGVNLNLNKACTFDCVYCQVDRRSRRRGISKRLLRQQALDLNVLAAELEQVLRTVSSSRLWRQARFAQTPPELRRINDIAFSGNGEPTCLPTFDEAVAIAADIKRRLGLTDVKTVVITNGTQLHRPQFQRAILILRRSGGEIWAKLDAGSERLFKRINRPRMDITLTDVTRNITAVSKRLPVVIQSLFFRSRGHAPSAVDVAAYCHRLQAMLDSGARLKEVHIHTIARSPAEPAVSWLTNQEMDALTAAIAAALPALTVTPYYGADMPPQRH